MRQVVSRLWMMPICSAPSSVQLNSQLFAETAAGATASANLYTLVESAKANGLDLYAYLRHLFTELRRAQTVEAIEALLPTADLATRLPDPAAETCGSSTAYG
jgi:hypothetical protein